MKNSFVVLVGLTLVFCSIAKCNLLEVAVKTVAAGVCTFAEQCGKSNPFLTWRCCEDLSGCCWALTDLSIICISAFGSLVLLILLCICCCRMCCGDSGGSRRREQPMVIISQPSGQLPGIY